jgi:hypothetical protein
LRWGNFFASTEKLFGRRAAGVLMLVTLLPIVCTQLSDYKFRTDKRYLELIQEYPWLLRKNETPEGSEKRMKPVYEVLYLLFTYFIWLPVIVYVIVC